MTLTKKREWEHKQKQADKLICEGTERITAVLKAGTMIDVLPASDVAFPEKYSPENFQKISEEPDKYVLLMNYNFSLVKHSKQQVFLYVHIIYNIKTNKRTYKH